MKGENEHKRIFKSGYLHVVDRGEFAKDSSSMVAKLEGQHNTTDIISLLILNL